MKYKTPAKELFIQNRARFMAQMKPNTIAIFHANDQVMNNGDGYYRFTQNSNTYYLSGLDQEEVILLLFPDAPNPAWKEMLFIRKTSEHIQIWEGWKYSKEEATAASGVEMVRFYEEFESALFQMVSHFDGVYLDFNEHERNVAKTHTAAHRIAEKFKHEYPAHELHRAAPILQDLRSVKSKEEIAQLQEACHITDKAFRRILRFVKPGVYENQIEAEIMHEFLWNRATGAAYDPIIASGRNACVLHYIQNEAECKNGDVLLMDFGAEYGNYSADLSRSIPVSGKFSDRQKAVYNACLRVFKQAKQMLRPGTILEEYHKEVGKIMTSELIGLGLLTKKEVANENPNWPAYKKYFMHGTSHSLGLDTHDTLNRYAPMKEGMVFTCEPGIYILEENLGIRIENDIVVTANGPVDLMENIPIEADEIEELMQAAK